MNATDQRQRHTAVTRLAGEVETVLDDYSKRTGDGIKAAIQGTLQDILAQQTQPIAVAAQ